MHLHGLYGSVGAGLCKQLSMLPFDIDRTRPPPLEDLSTLHQPLYAVHWRMNDGTIGTSVGGKLLWMSYEQL